MSLDNISASLTYDPSIFNVDSVERAKWVILNPDGVHTPEQRWEKETEYLLNLIDKQTPGYHLTCLDYGCGIGRLAKPLIERKDWAVIGADISPSMRGFSVGYVASSRFVACDPAALDQLSLFGVQFDVAIAVWSLQHVRDLDVELARIESTLTYDGYLFVLNAQQRFVPTREVPWLNDGVDVWSALEKRFKLISKEPVDTSIIPTPPTFWGVFEKSGS